MTSTKAPEHPAKWSGAVLTAITHHVGPLLPAGALVLDPFAGVGRARLAAALPGRQVVGVELQPEWAADRDTLVSDATALPDDWTGRFDAVVTSASYGNRMADHHDARDACKDCKGSGLERDTFRAAEWDANDPTSETATGPCATCKGAGLSWRNTYTHALRRAGAEVVAGSAAVLQWGKPYRDLHRAAIAEMRRVTKPGAPIAVNMSNHIRDGREQLVAEWWTNELLVAGAKLVTVVPVPTPRNRRGANGSVRVDGELLIVVRRP